MEVDAEAELVVDREGAEKVRSAALAVPAELFVNVLLMFLSEVAVLLSRVTVVLIDARIVPRPGLGVAASGAAPAATVSSSRGQLGAQTNRETLRMRRRWKR